MWVASDLRQARSTQTPQSSVIRAHSTPMSPGIKILLAHPVRSGVCAPDVADLVAVPGEMQRVRLEQLQDGDIVALEVRHLAIEIGARECRDPPAIADPRGLEPV